MTKHLTSLLFLFLFLGSTLAQIPNGYYDQAQGKTGDELKSVLNDIISGHKELKYDKVYKALYELDRDPKHPENVLCLYSNFSIPASIQSDNSQGWNREHVWAKSRGDFGTKPGAGTDLHHIAAADCSTNSNRNNRNFGVGDKPFTDTKGKYFGPTECKKGDNWVWEPQDDIKGDVARMIFYMTVRYEGENDEPDLELTNEYLAKDDKRPLHSNQDLLLQWHFQDPVDEREKRRNDLIYSKYQNNRNPFIDHPEYVYQIWPSTVPMPEAAIEYPLDKNKDHIQIGTYNLYWLGSEMRYNKGLREKKDVERIAKLVTEELDLEVIVFQEVNVSENGFNKGKEFSSQQFDWLKEAMKQKGYAMYWGSTGHTQRIVMAYDSTIVSCLSKPKDMELANSFRINESCKSRGLRKPLIGQFKAGEFDFYLVGVHLISKKKGDCSDKIRETQAEELTDALNQLKESGEKDIIITGDFNSSRKNYSLSPFYYSGGFNTLTWPGRMREESGEYSYLIGDWKNVIDHVMIDPIETKEWVKNSTIIYLPPNIKDYINNYSDHVPVWADFDISEDRD